MSTTIPLVAELDVLDRLRDPETLQEPYPFYAWLREHAPVHRNPTGDVYLVSRNADARSVYQSPDVRSITTGELAARMPRWKSSRMLQGIAGSIGNASPPVHTRLRRALTPYFTLRQAQLLQSAAERHCDRLLADVETRLRDGERADLQSTLTEPLGVAMAGDILGIPEADREGLTRLILRVLEGMHPTAGGEALAAVDDAYERVDEYFVAMAAQRRRKPADDLATALLTSVVDGDHEPDQGLSEPEYRTMLWTMWLGGFETTVTAMGSGVLAMLDFPEQARFLDGDAADVKAFVSETLRFNPPVLVEAMPRIACRDLELSGVFIPEGADLRPLHGAANRDPEAFPEPDRFDPARKTARMVTFGHGIHHCIGANLAKMECAGALPRIRRRLPGLAVTGRPVLRTSLSLRTFTRFPVVLGPVPS